MSDPDVIRSALLFEASYLFLMFAAAVLTALVGIELLRRRQARALLTGAPITLPREPVARRHVVGSLLFGLGWGLADARPGPIATQARQGGPGALFPVVGAHTGVCAFLRRGARETEPAADARAPS